MIYVSLFLPSILCLFYFMLLATPRYVAEAKFIVRTAAKAPTFNNLAAFLQLTGLSRSQDDAFSILDFMTSRDAVAKLVQTMPLKEFYSNSGADFVARYPSILYGSTDEQFYHYFQTMISVSFNHNTGISSLAVQAFKPEQAGQIAEGLLSAAEVFVNALNKAIYEDAVKVSEEQVARHRRELIDAQLALTTFRNKELMIDPASSTAVVSEVLKTLSGNLAEVRTQINEMSSASPSSPQLSTLQTRAAALSREIAFERARISSSTDGIANQIGSYEQLNLKVDFAKKALEASTASLESAQADALRKQLYLVRIVQPHVADYPTEPSSFRNIATVLAGNLLMLLVGWLFFTGIREHSATLRGRLFK